MRQLTFQKTCNGSKLDAEIRAVINSNLDGVAANGTTVIVTLIDAAPPGDDATVTSIVNAHSASVTAEQAFRTEQSPLVGYYRSILLSLYQDVDNGGVTMTQMLTNAANIVGTNATQAAKFNGFRSRLGLSGAIGSLTATQQGQLLVLGLEWAAAGLAVASAL